MLYLVDRLPGPLAAMLTARWEQPYSNVVNFMQVRMPLAVMRSNILLLRTERTKSKYQWRMPDGADAYMSGRGLV